MIIMLKGLPASGKSTWAKERIDENAFTRVSRDDLRMMIYNGVYDSECEDRIKDIQDYIIRLLVSADEAVIIDNTNLKPIDEAHYKWLANELKTDFEIMDFTNISLEVCIERDKNRPVPVGEKVIRDMYEKYLI